MIIDPAMSPLLSLKRFIVAMNSLPHTVLPINGNNALNVKSIEISFEVLLYAVIQTWVTALLE